MACHLLRRRCSWLQETKRMRQTPQSKWHKEIRRPTAPSTMLLTAPEHLGVTLLLHALAQLAALAVAPVRLCNSLQNQQHTSGHALVCWSSVCLTLTRARCTPFRALPPCASSACATVSRACRPCQAAARSARPCLGCSGCVVRLSRAHPAHLLAHSHLPGTLKCKLAPRTSLQQTGLPPCM